MKAIGAVGIELWSMSKDIYFDNILITDDLEQANAWAADTFDLKVTKIDKSEGGMFARLLDYSNKNPWLYAVYVVVIGLPLVLIVTFCCTGSGSSAAQKDSLNDPKKTDEPQSDDDQDAEEEAAVEDDVGEQGDAGDGNDEGEEEVEDEEEEEDDVEDAEEEKEVSSGPVTRKRKPRKD
jgi:calnexin